MGYFVLLKRLNQRKFSSCLVRLLVSERQNRFHVLISLCFFILFYFVIFHSLWHNCLKVIAHVFFVCLSSAVCLFVSFLRLHCRNCRRQTANFVGPLQAIFIARDQGGQFQAGEIGLSCPLG